MTLFQKSIHIWQSTPDFLQAFAIWILFVAVWIGLGLWAAGYSDRHY